MLQEFEKQAERWAGYYHNLPGQRVLVEMSGEAAPNEYYLLGQEFDYLVCAKNPVGDEPRQYAMLRKQEVVSCKPMDKGEPLPAVPHASEQKLEQSNMLFAQGRVALHALVPSGARAHLEVTGVEPPYGGFFVSPNHLFGFALHHLHQELRNKGLIGPQDLPMRQDFWRVPTGGLSQSLPLAAKPPATLMIYALETRSDQLAGISLPFTHDEGSRILGSKEKVLAWGYESLCAEAVKRQLLPPEFKARVRRAQLH